MSKWSATIPISKYGGVIDAIRYDGRRIVLPAAAIIIGGNDETLEKVTDELTSAVSLYKVQEISCEADLDAIPDDLLRNFTGGMMYHCLFIRLIRGSSVNHSLRHKTVEKVKALGAEKVTMVWVKGDPECDNPNARAVDEALRKNPPNVDGIDCLLTWEP